MPGRPYPLGLRLDSQSLTPLYRQIYASIARAIRDGQLPPNTRLPSARSLAAQLGLARGTVETAYEMLAAEGYVVARRPTGTWVSPQLSLQQGRSRRAARGTSREPSIDIDRRPASPLTLLRVGLPALDAFPHKLWARLLARQARAIQPADLDYLHPAGLEALRVQIARYLAVARGVSCTPDQILLTSGFKGALSLTIHDLLHPGDTVWVEDPAYPDSRDALRKAGMRVVGVPVDAEGFDVTRAASAGPPARLVLVTPTHHYPLGVTLSLPRRLALLEWAARADAYIIEDDYDSQFRYSGQPLPALKSLDSEERVLYAGTFSKVLSPSLRLGYLVVPARLVARLTETAWLLHPQSSALVQATLASFIERGDLARHIRRMRGLYAQRRAALVEALSAQVGTGLEVEDDPSGMHLLARLPADTDDIALVARLKEQGLAPSALSACGVEAPYAPGLLLGFTNVAVLEAGEVAGRLAEVLHARGLGR